MPIDGFEAGLKVRREVLGDEYVDRAFEGVTDFDREFQEFVTAVAWGQVWTRDGLSRRDRSLLNLGMLAALGRSTELATHVRAGLGNGLTPAEIAEAFRQVRGLLRRPRRARGDAHRQAGAARPGPGRMSSAVAPGTTAITGVTLIDGTGADPVADASLVIEDGRIASVGRLEALPQGAEVIDASGMTLLPGLIDSHVHFYSSWKSMQQRALTPPTLATFEAAQNALATIDAGFTAVREASGSPAGFKLAVERGLIPGPRMRIAVGGALADRRARRRRAAERRALLAALGPGVDRDDLRRTDEVRKTVRAVLRVGADFIKLPRHRRRDVALGRARLAAVPPRKRSP